MLTPVRFARWRAHARDLLLLTLLALAARIIAALVVDYPPYTDPAYYTLVAQRLAEGHGFTVPVLWSFLEVGGRLPAEPTLPVPSNGHWMPLTSIVSSAAMAALGTSWRAGQLPMVLLSAALVPFTYLVGRDLWRSRSVALLSGLLAVFAGPLLLMYPTIDNFALFGLTGGAAIYASTRAVRSPHPGRWLVAAGAAAGLATLARVDGFLLLVAPATAWLVARSRSATTGRPTVASALMALGAFALVLAPWLLRNLAIHGRPLPSAGGHTLWITSYNEQFSIGHDVTLARYLDWGLLNIVGSKIEAAYELAGRTAVLLGGVFFIFFLAGLWIFRRRLELAPFHAYFGVMFVAMTAVFTFHAPKGAFYHSAPAWLPFAFPMAVAAVPVACSWFGRWWRFLRRPAAQRFLAVASTGGAVVLSLVAAAVLNAQWSHSRARDLAAGSFFRERGLTHDRVMYSDPASLYAASGNPGIASPFDAYPVLQRVVEAYDVRWVVVSLADGAEIDPLGLWHGSSSVDADGNRATWLTDSPAFEADGVRIYRVRPSTIGPP